MHLYRVVACALVVVACRAQAQPSQASTASQWQESTPAEQGLDAAVFANLERNIASAYPDIRSAVVVRHGRLVFEYYRWGHTRDTLHNGQSVTKVVTSALIGVAMQHGLIAGLDLPVVKVLPEAAADGSDTRAKEITLGQLLTMTAGFEGPAASVSSYAALDDPVRTGMSRPLFAAPGLTFSYDNGSAHMVSAVLSRVTNSSASKFAEQHLFGPLGIERYRWPADRRGNNLGHNALALTTRDMAKLGQLHLQEGAWGGKQLLPMAYVRAATSKQNAGGPPVGLDYGYFWWVAPSSAPRAPYYFASGWGGQVIFVHPALDIVIAVTSDITHASHTREHAGALIHRHVLRAASQ